MALGKQGKVRDVSVRITSYQPYCYVKQKARVSAAESEIAALRSLLDRVCAELDIPRS